MDVAVVGLGYVGAVTSACLAEMGHTVVGVDVDRQKVDEIEAGRSPIVEPRLEELVAAGRKIRPAARDDRSRERPRHMRRRHRLRRHAGPE